MMMMMRDDAPVRRVKGRRAETGVRWIFRSTSMRGRVVTRRVDDDEEDATENDDVDMIATTTTDDDAPRGVSDVKRESGACLGRLIDDYPSTL